MRPVVEQPSLSGRSILVVEGEPFIARCLEMILQAAGADVRRAANACEGLSIADQSDLSAAVLDFQDGLRDCDHGIARRLTERGLPFMFYGGHAGGHCKAWPSAPLASKWTSGGEIIETLCALIVPPQSGRITVTLSAAPVPFGVNRPRAARAMAHIESLMRRRRSLRARDKV